MLKGAGRRVLCGRSFVFRQSWQLFEPGENALKRHFTYSGDVVRPVQAVASPVQIAEP